MLLVLPDKYWFCTFCSPPPHTQTHTYKLHGTESFLRSQQFLSLSGSTPHFMEPEVSLLHVSIPSQISPVHASSHVLKIHFRTIHSCTRRSPKWYISLLSLHQNDIHVSRLEIPSRRLTPASYSINFFVVILRTFEKVLVVSCSSDRGAWFRLPVHLPNEEHTSWTLPAVCHEQCMD